MAQAEDKTQSTQGFLDAEEASRRVLASLEALRNETEGYAAAERTLRESGQSIVRLVGRVEELAEHVVAALDAFGAMREEQKAADDRMATAFARLQKRTQVLLGVVGSLVAAILVLIVVGLV